MSFNHFKIKREAHALSRHSTDPRFSPFAHFTWGRPKPSSGPERSSSVPRGLEESREDAPVYSAPSGYRGNRRNAGVHGSAPDLSSPPQTSFGKLTSSTDNGSAHRPSVETQPSTVKDTTALENCDGTLESGAIHRERKRREKKPLTVGSQLIRIFLSSWANLFLLCLPVGFALHSARGNSVETFVVNLIVAVPLLVLTDFSLGEIALRVGDRLSELLYIFTVNIGQLITCILLVANHQEDLVQLNVTGSILANLLFILGLALVFGSARREYQYFNHAVAHVSSNLLSLAGTSLLIPTASRLLSQASEENLVRQSRGSSIVLILVYSLYLIYQLITHKKFFDEPGQKVPAHPFKQTLARGVVTRALVNPAALMGGRVDESQMATILGRDGFGEDEEEEEDPQLHFGVALITFVATTVLSFFCIDFAVNSIDALTSQTPISKTFVALILLPIPNCDFTAIKLAIYDRLDGVINCTVGKCLQSALLVTPMVVLIAWGFHVDLTLVFDGFEVVSLFTSILLLNFLMTEERVSWLQGVLLLTDWVLIGLAAFYCTL